MVLAMDAVVQRDGGCAGDDCRVAGWPATTAWLTIAVQLGFVGGTCLSAILLLSDRLSPRRLAALSHWPPVLRLHCSYGAKLADTGYLSFVLLRVSP
jgi:hypothetical protein